MIRVTALLLCAAALTAANAPAPAKPAGPPNAELKTLMCDRGKLLFEEDFSTDSLAKNWGGFIAGTWTPGDNLVQVTPIAGAKSLGLSPWPASLRASRASDSRSGGRCAVASFE